MTMTIILDNSTAMYILRPKNLTPWRDFEPGIFCSGGGRDGHYANPPLQPETFYLIFNTDSFREKSSLKFLGHLCTYFYVTLSENCPRLKKCPNERGSSWQNDFK
jgi:hypothetical protein